MNEVKKQPCNLKALHQVNTPPIMTFSRAAQTYYLSKRPHVDLITTFNNMWTSEKLPSKRK